MKFLPANSLQANPPPPRRGRHIARELKDATEEVCELEGQGAAHVALQAAMLLMKGDGVRDVPEALLAILEVAGAA
jgi:hypothetical protein